MTAMKTTIIVKKMAVDKSLIQKSAVEVVDLLKNYDITPIDLLDTLENRIEEVDQKINALPTLCFDRARKHAEALGKLSHEERGILAGLPIPIKDLTPVKDVRFTSGSLLFKNNIAKKSDLIVERIEERGGVIYAKSNTPEFGAGGNTFNDVFGTTVNPWDLSKSTAGSSGGAAAALASGMAWVAHGSDMGGSLRNPASFCSVVGLRPSPGRVPTGPKLLPFQNLGVQGPMARNVADTALFLDAMTGPTPLDPWSLPRPERSFFTASQSGQKPVKVAYSSSLGFMPVESEVASICTQAALRFEERGIIVEETHPELKNVLETFWALRSHLFATSLGSMAVKNPELFKPELLENIKAGFNLSSKNLIKAEQSRGSIYNTMANFFNDYDVLIAPTTIVPPFPVEQRFVKHCDGQKFSTYVDWLGVAFPATLASCPAISLPAGFTSSGLPVGLQLIGRQKGEAALLSAAQLLENQIGISQLPINPRPGS
jgi:amidase